MGKLVPQFDSLLALIADMPQGEQESLARLLSGVVVISENHETMTREQEDILHDLEMKKVKPRRKRRRAAPSDSNSEEIVTGKLVPEFDSLLALIADMPEARQRSFAKATSKAVVERENMKTMTRAQNRILCELEIKKIKARRKK